MGTKDVRELIERLAEHAGFTVFQGGIWAAADHGGDDDCSRLLPAFAALIAEECAKVNIFPTINIYESDSPHARHYQDGVRHLREAIREKFSAPSLPASQ